MPRDGDPDPPTIDLALTLLPFRREGTRKNVSLREGPDEDPGVPEAVIWSGGARSRHQAPQCGDSAIVFAVILTPGCTTLPAAIASPTDTPKHCWTTTP